MHIRKGIRQLVLFLIGGAVYLLIELLWRGYTSPFMFIIGGICFCVIGASNEEHREGLSVWLQTVFSTLYVVLIEFISGLILNVWWGLNLWDYSNMPGNFLGQICPQFTAAWLVLAFVGIFLDDWLRHILFKEPWPKYNWGIRYKD